MDAILSVFEFAVQSIGLLFARFGLELLTTVLVAYLVALIILTITKKKNQEIGFSNWFKVCFMWGVVAAVLALGVIVILTMRMNGLHYFSRDAFSFTWYCGYLLMTPEILLMIGWVTVFCVLNSCIYKSLK